jgi:hypothetical protein
LEEKLDHFNLRVEEKLSLFIADPKDDDIFYSFLVGEAISFTVNTTWL